LVRLLGIPIYIEPSWFLVALLVTWSLATGVFPQTHPEAAPITLWLMGAAGAVGLFACVLLHELSHAMVARRFDVQIRGITLWLFGGVAEMTKEPEHARDEFFIAIAGPLMSFALGVVFLALEPLARVVGLGEVGTVTGHLAYLNFVLAVFNLVPAFPLDGGRVLRAALWARNQDLTRSTRITARLGAAFGVGFITLGVLSAITGNLIGGLWLALIGLFLRGAAKGSYSALVTRNWLGGAAVSRFMTRVPVTVPSHLSLDELVGQYVLRTHHRLYPVVDHGRLVGCVRTRDVGEVPEEQWATKRVANILRPLDDSTTISATTTGEEALQRMSSEDQSRLIVLDGGALVGVLALKDLLDYLAVRAELSHESAL
jgi:Zn-dependent protease